MNKQEFLNKLRKKIDILEESEVEDILKEYSGFIEEKMSQGSTEEEAIKSLGNIDELASELLSAYKIKKPQEKKNDILNNFIEEFVAIIENIIEFFSTKDFKEIVRFILEMLCIFIIIALCRLPFELIAQVCKNIIYNISSSLGSPIPFHIIGNLGKAFLEICYVLFAIILFIKIFEKRYLNSQEPNFNFHPNPKKEKIKEHPRSSNPEKIVKNVNPNSKNLLDILTSFCIIGIKIIVFFLLIGLIFYIIGLTAAFSISVYLLFKGVFYFGIYLIILALLILGIIVFLTLFNFIFNRQTNFFIILIISLISFGLLGLGIAVSAIEITNTTIYYDNKDVSKPIKTLEYKMQDNLVLEGYYNEIIIDDKLDDQIRIEYCYNTEYFDISIEPTKSRENKYEIIHLEHCLNQFKYNKNMFNNLINDLKEKVIRTYNYDVVVKIYTSKEVKDKLLKNQKQYEEYEEYIEENEIDFEDLHETYHDLSYHH